MTQQDFAGALDSEKAIEALGSSKRGSGQYPPYMYLWHLVAIGVLDANGPKSEDYEVTDAVWFDDHLSARPARVALIDTGCAGHPNLGRRLNRDLAVDFGTHQGGSVYVGTSDFQDVLARLGLARAAGDPTQQQSYGKLADLHSPEDVRTLIDKLAVDLAADAKSALVDAIAARTQKGVAIRDLSAQQQRFPAHGTASAGLVVGAPAKGGGEADAARTLPYFGVDPFSEVVPIATSFEPEPLQLILALLYAFTIDADVILMPRGTDNPTKGRPDPRESVEGTRYDGFAHEWTMLDAVLRAVSKHIPVVLAAGNDGDDRLVYPSSLAEDDNGIIAVGAVTAEARRAGYANYGDGLTAVAPSNDASIYTRHQIRLDPMARAAVSHNWLIHPDMAKSYVKFAFQAPLTIDIPGPRGYRGGLGPSGSDYALRADYTLFGGTSAAAAITAGVLALMRRAVPQSCAHTWTGPFAKSVLTATAGDTIFGEPLVPDLSNEGDTKTDAATLKTRLFGHGMINAKRAIAETHNRLP